MHDHGGPTIRKIDGGYVVLDNDGKVLTIATTRARAETFARHHVEARRVWCGCAGLGGRHTEAQP
jgi:hypothetical protein